MAPQAPAAQKTAADSALSKKRRRDKRASRRRLYRTAAPTRPAV